MMGYTTKVGNATFHDILLGSIFDSGADVLVCPVNCVPGVMGKGLALEFAKRWPNMRDIHRDDCTGGRIRPGGGSMMLTWGPNPAAVWFFPTKRHWKNPSRLEDIRDGMTALSGHILARVEHHGHWPYGSPDGRRVGGIAIPALGCGLGGLRWEDVRPLIVEAMAPLDITVMLYAPKEGDA